MQSRRLPWQPIIGAVLLIMMLLLAMLNASIIGTAFLLAHEALPGWLAIAILAIGAAFVCAGCIYGRVLASLGYHVRQLWLSAAAFVCILISQTIPAGTLGSYAFLTISLRRRGVPSASVALVASLELLSWVGAMLLFFSYGLVYMLITTGDGRTLTTTMSAATGALVLLIGGLYVGSRPRATLYRWLLSITTTAERVLGLQWTKAHIRRIVDDVIRNRDLLGRKPGQVCFLVGLQLGVFLLHGIALIAILHSLGVHIAPHAVLAAYGLSLIVSTFTLLPGGGGAVETALTFALGLQGVTLETALGASILFRLLSFWLLLPLGIVCYRFLMIHNERQPTGDE